MRLREKDLIFYQLLTANMKGDTTRTKHDGILHQIFEETRKAFTTKQEPSDAFRHVNGGGQGMRPDMMTIDTTTSTIYDVKTVPPCPTHYNQPTLRLCHTKPCSVVEKRQGQVHKEYVNKAMAIDRKNKAPSPGPALAHLESFGRVRCLVIGPRGEASSDLHALVERVCTTNPKKSPPVDIFRSQRGDLNFARAMLPLAPRQKVLLTCLQDVVQLLYDIGSVFLSRSPFPTRQVRGLPK